MQASISAERCSAVCLVIFWILEDERRTLAKQWEYAALAAALWLRLVLGRKQTLAPEWPSGRSGCPRSAINNGFHFYPESQAEWTFSRRVDAANELPAS